LGAKQEVLVGVPPPRFRSSGFNRITGVLKFDAKAFLRAAAYGATRPRIVRRIANPVERLFMHFIVATDPQIALEPLFGYLNGRATFDSVPNYPERLRGFEDLAFLFSNNHLNVGIAVLAFDEGAHLYRLIRSLPRATVVEIGRLKGGSTFLMGAALTEGSHLYSYDWFSGSATPLPKSNGTMRRPGRGRPEFDQQLERALERYGLAGRVHPIVADSRTAAPPAQGCDLVFIDGDHSYEGVRADYEHWAPHVRAGGRLVFHDAVARDLAPSAVGVSRLVEEIESEKPPRFRREPAVGSIAQFVRAIG
jgi:predicted O-methyltransferase YrrM